MLTIALIIAGILALGAAVVIVCVIIITLVLIQQYWARSPIKKEHQERFMTLFREGNFDIVHAGLWNKDTEQVEEAKTWRATDIDKELTDLVPYDEVIIL